MQRQIDWTILGQLIVSAVSVVIYGKSEEGRFYTANTTKRSARFVSSSWR